MILAPPALDGCTTFASTPGTLTAIHQPNCAAAVWQCKPLTRFQDWIDRLPPDQLPKTRMILRPEAVCDAQIDVTRRCAMPDCFELKTFSEGTRALASIFASVMNSADLRVPFEVITSNVCRKFHVHAEKAGLVCTYRGAGMQTRELQPKTQTI